jgi:hypothetical protein
MRKYIKSVKGKVGTPIPVPQPSVFLFSIEKLLFRFISSRGLLMNLLEADALSGISLDGLVTSTTLR